MLVLDVACPNFAQEALDVSLSLLRVLPALPTGTDCKVPRIPPYISYISISYIASRASKPRFSTCLPITSSSVSRRRLKLPFRVLVRMSSHIVRDLQTPQWPHVHLFRRSCLMSSYRFADTDLKRVGTVRCIHVVNHTKRPLHRMAAEGE
jgi:hypothetical protein